MKQNNLISNNNDINNKIYENNIEINNLYNLIMLKYEDKYEKKIAKKIAKLLYLNGIKPYMFFDERFDIDEIVFYIAKNINVIKFYRNKEYHFDSETKNNNNAPIININKYLIKHRK